MLPASPTGRPVSASFGRGNSCGDGSITRRATVRVAGSIVQRSKGTRFDDGPA